MDQLFNVSEGQVSLSLQKQMSPEHRLQILETALLTLLLNQTQALLASSELSSKGSPIPTEVPAPKTTVASKTTEAPKATQAPTQEAITFPEGKPEQKWGINGYYFQFPNGETASMRNLSQNQINSLRARPESTTETPKNTIDGVVIPEGKPFYRGMGGNGIYYAFNDNVTIHRYDLTDSQFAELESRGVR